MSSVVGADGGGDVPARGGEPAGGLATVDVLRALLFVTAVLKAAAKPPIVLRTRGSAGGDGGVVGAAGVPGAGLAWAAPVTGVVAGGCRLSFGMGVVALGAGVGLCG